MATMNKMDLANMTEEQVLAAFRSIQGMKQQRDRLIAEILERVEQLNETDETKYTLRHGIYVVKPGNVEAKA